VDVQQLEVDQAGPPAPAGLQALAQLTASEPHQRYIHRQLGRLRTDVGVDRQEEPPGLWGHLIQRLPQHA
jgi:hypothetical protein